MGMGVVWQDGRDSSANAGYVFSDKLGNITFGSWWDENG